jgi:hypothetical protein
LHDIQLLDVGCVGRKMKTNQRHAMLLAVMLTIAATVPGTQATRQFSNFFRVESSRPVLAGLHWVGRLTQNYDYGRGPPRSSHSSLKQALASFDNAFLSVCAKLQIANIDMSETDCGGTAAEESCEFKCVAPFSASGKATCNSALEWDGTPFCSSVVTHFLVSSTDFTAKKI